MSDPQKYLLDTNILSDLVRHPAGLVAKHIAKVGENSVCTSIIVAAELRFGAQKNGSSRLRRQLELILSEIVVLPFEEPADDHYAKLRWYLEKQGTPIGPNDLLIAAQALSLSLVVVTANIKEFTRVPELVVNNWLKS